MGCSDIASIYMVECSTFSKTWIGTQRQSVEMKSHMWYWDAYTCIQNLSVIFFIWNCKNLKISRYVKKGIKIDRK